MLVKKFLLKPKSEFKIGIDRRYKVKAICKSIVYTNKIIEDKQLGLYYFIFQKCYPKANNI